MMKLFIYDHCPYCVRARMVFGLKNLPVQLCILPNDDADTPISMIGKKIVPILQKDDGSYMAESLDIVNYVDNLDGNPLISTATTPAITAWLDEVNSYVQHLLMPRIVKAPFAEFIGEQARAGFIERKEKIIGDFYDNLYNNDALIQRLNIDLARLAPLINLNDPLSYDDILLFPLLRNIDLIMDSSNPPEIIRYKLRMKKLTRINLLNSIA